MFGRVRWASPRPGIAIVPALALVLFALSTTVAAPQEPSDRGPVAGRLPDEKPGALRAPTAADYARAERFLAPAVMPLVIGGSVLPDWLSGDRFWYRNQVRDGHEFVLVTPAARTRKPAFDHARLAAALSAATGSPHTAHALPFDAIELSADATRVSFDVGARRWTCDTGGAT